MANIDSPFGAKPVRHIGSPWNGQVTRYAIVTADDTAIGIGDFVKLNGGTDAVGIRAVTRSGANDASVGVVVGKEIDPTNLNTPQYRAGDAAGYLLVVDDPNAYFEMQEDGNAGVASAGLNCSLVVGNPSTLTGTSIFEIDSSEVTTDATDLVKLIEPVQRPDNDGVAANAKWIVKINNHQLGAHTGTAGV